jgi:hypothetical protein
MLNNIMNKKNQFVVFAVIILLIVAGYVGSVSKQKIPRQNSGKIERPRAVDNEAEILGEITYVNASLDMIVPELPFPGAVTGKTFGVIGRARGSWFFEASFPVTVLDKDGNVLAQSYAMTADDWMTNEFVDFRGEVSAPEWYIGPATMILSKDNPSGLPEHDAHISFPITIEY